MNEKRTKTSARILRVKIKVFKATLKRRQLLHKIVIELLEGLKVLLRSGSGAGRGNSKLSSYNKSEGLEA